MKRWLGLGLALWLTGCAGTPRVEPTRMPTPRPTPAHAPLAELPVPKQGLTPVEEEPVHIAADRLQYREQGKTTLFSGHVIVSQGMAKLFAPQLEVRSEQGTALAQPNVQLIDPGRGITLTAQSMEYDQNFSHFMARGEVELAAQNEKGEQIRLTSRRLEWLGKEKTAVAQEDVKVYYQDMTATAGQATYLQGEQQLIMTPLDLTPTVQPVLLRGEDVITGDKITLSVRQRIYEIAGAAKALLLPRKGQSIIQIKEQP